MNTDYVCIGYDVAGYIKHWTVGTKECVQNCAKQIRSHYKSVRVVTWDIAQELNEIDNKKYWENRLHMLEELGV